MAANHSLDDAEESIRKLLARFENACAGYWQKDSDERVSDRRLRELDEKMTTTRRELLNGISSALRAATASSEREPHDAAWLLDELIRRGRAQVQVNGDAWQTVVEWLEAHRALLPSETPASETAKDAARYRFLRGAYSIMPGTPGKRPIEWYCGADADAAVDAAMMAADGDRAKREERK